MSDLAEDLFELRSTRVNDDWRLFWDQLWIPFIQPELVRLSKENRDEPASDAEVAEKVFRSMSPALRGSHIVAKRDLECGDAACVVYATSPEAAEAIAVSLGRVRRVAERGWVSTASQCVMWRRASDSEPMERILPDECPHCGKLVDSLLGDCRRLTTGFYDRLCKECRDSFQDAEDEELEAESE